MITLEQVKLLEEKVESLIAVVKSLYVERDSLKVSLAQKEGRIVELESALRSFEATQAKIEESVMSTLNQLDVFENSVAIDSSSVSDSSGIINSEEFALSTTSESTQMDENHSDVSAEREENNASIEDRTHKIDDSDRQMDIF